MTTKTVGELIFEEFCALNSISCKKIAEGEQPTPDYEMLMNDQIILVEREYKGQPNYLKFTMFFSSD